MSPAACSFRRTEGEEEEEIGQKDDPQLASQIAAVLLGMGRHVASIDAENCTRCSKGHEGIQGGLIVSHMFGTV